MESAVRSALDVPAKVRRHPLETAGAAGGLAFLVLGGPRRVANGVNRLIFGKPKRPTTLLPKEIDKAIKGLGKDAEKVRERLDKEFADYLAKKEKDLTAGSAQRSFWRLFDTLSKPLASLAAAKVAAKLFAPEPERPATDAGESPSILGQARATAAPPFRPGSPVPPPGFTTGRPPAPQPPGPGPRGLRLPMPGSSAPPAPRAGPPPDRSDPNRPR